jgi:hypothetical protein
MKIFNVGLSRCRIGMAYRAALKGNGAIKGQKVCFLTAHFVCLAKKDIKLALSIL